MSEIDLEPSTPPKKKTKTVPLPLLKSHFDEPNVYEIGVDEVGRGPLFGRVYTAAVVLPKDDSFDCSMVKDSKKFHSKAKIEAAAEYVRQHALAWYVSYEDEKRIDEINILQATQLSMHQAIHQVRNQCASLFEEKGTCDAKLHLLVDGNYFRPFTYIETEGKDKKMASIPHTTIEGGDNKYASIAAASILAKVERDKYIADLCQEHPELAERYALDDNKGYGAKKHLLGIQQYGITQWHRKTFGICKQFS